MLGLEVAGPAVVPHKRWNEGWGGFYDVDCTTEWMEQSLENWLRFLLLPFFEQPPAPAPAQQQGGGVAKQHQQQHAGPLHPCGVLVSVEQ